MAHIQPSDKLGQLRRTHAEETLKTRVLMVKTAKRTKYAGESHNVGLTKCHKLSLSHHHFCECYVNHPQMVGSGQLGPDSTPLPGAVLSVAAAASCQGA